MGMSSVAPAIDRAEIKIASVWVSGRKTACYKVRKRRIELSKRFTEPLCRYFRWYVSGLDVKAHGCRSAHTIMRLGARWLARRRLWRLAGDQVATVRADLNTYFICASSFLERSDRAFHFEFSKPLWTV
jgi:hypothetical protein